ncbi:relaxase domain-containing protein [Paracraurococcus lichenis]|uniref:Relaxase domain-containing protein n=1 Tax=Paracraurococcus lichenis TaxID=3064888 RepID=A0ABT9E867_9PROT|nr:relaxase domain-containing protein [Paracraurococcus sp. LOR1-02]MDO9712393.1 relaxase domain-containing protein [Paracraurococcus sp. LOR1-02]
MAFAYVDLAKTRSPVRMAAHLTHPTEPKAERDAAARLANEPPAREPGTPLRPWEGMHPAAAEAMRAEPGKALTKEQLTALVGGKRADGSEMPRPKRARRYTGGDADGKQAVKFVHFILSPHPSWSLAHANAATPAGAAVIASVFERATSKMLADVEARSAVAVVRKDKQRIEVRGRFAAWGATHHTTRPFKDGTAAPGLHKQFVVPNAVVLPNREIRAIDARKLIELAKDRAPSALLSHHLQEEGRAAGLRVEQRNGVAVLSDVPDHVVEHFSRRSREAEEHAKAYTLTKGQVWTDLTERQRQVRVKIGMRATEGATRDGMADRPAWRRQCENLGWPPTDLAGQEPIRSAPRPQRATPGAQGRGDLHARVASLRSASVQTRQHAQRLRQAAELGIVFGPSIAARVAENKVRRVLDNPRSRRALLGSARILQAGAQAFYRRYQVRTAYRMGVAIRRAWDRSLTVKAARFVARQLRPSVLRRRAEILADAARATLGAVRAGRHALVGGFQALREARDIQRLVPPAAADRAQQRVRAEVLQGRAQGRPSTMARAAGVGIGVRWEIEQLEALNRAHQSRMPAANLARSLRKRAETLEKTAAQTPRAAARASGLELAEQRNRAILVAIADATGQPAQAATTSAPVSTPAEASASIVVSSALVAKSAQGAVRDPMERLAEGFAESILDGRLNYASALDLLRKQETLAAEKGAERDPVHGTLRGAREPRPDKVLEAMMDRAIETIEKRAITGADAQEGGKGDPQKPSAPRPAADDLGPWAQLIEQGKAAAGNQPAAARPRRGARV